MTVSFEAKVQDAESEPPELSVTRDSDLDGRVNGAIADADGSVTFTTDGLSVGHHAITLSVTDPGGEGCTDDIDLNVEGAPAVTSSVGDHDDRALSHHAPQIRRGHGDGWGRHEDGPVHRQLRQARAPGRLHRVRVRRDRGQHAGRRQPGHVERRDLLAAD